MDSRPGRSSSRGHSFSKISGACRKRKAVSWCQHSFAFSRTYSLLCSFQTRRCIELSIRDDTTAILITQARDRERSFSSRNLMYDSRLSAFRRLRASMSSVQRSAALLFQISWCTVSAASSMSFGQWLQVICAATAVTPEIDDAEKAVAYGA